MSTELAVVHENPGLFAGPDERVRLPRETTLIAGMTPDDLRPGDKGAMPRISLVQKLDAANPDKQVGWWYETATGSCIKNPEIIALAELDRGQLRWPAKFSPENEPMCYSDNGWTPAEQSPERPMTHPQPGPCHVKGDADAGCEFAKWRRGAADDGGDLPPLCKYQRKWMVAVSLPTGAEPCVIVFQSTALGAAKKWSDKLLRVGFSQSFYLSSVRSTDGFDYYIPVMVDGQKLNAAGAALLGEKLEQYYGAYKEGVLTAYTDLDEGAIDAEATVRNTPPPPPPAAVEEDEDGEIPF